MAIMTVSKTVVEGSNPSGPAKFYFSPRVQNVYRVIGPISPGVYNVAREALDKAKSRRRILASMSDCLSEGASSILVVGATL